MAQCYSARLEIEDSLVRDSPEALQLNLCKTATLKKTKNCFSRPIMA